MSKSVSATRLPLASLLARLIRNLVVALVLTIAISSVLILVVPKGWLQNLVTNLFIFVPAIVAAVLRAFGKTWGEVKTVLIGGVVVLSIAIPLIAALFGGVVGVFFPEVYGEDGMLEVRNCSLTQGCDGFFRSRNVSGTVPIDIDQVATYHLHPGDVVEARIFAEKPAPGRQEWTGLEIRPARQTMSISTALLVTAAASLFWITIVVSALVYRIRLGSFGGLWNPSTAPFRGQTFGRVCISLGTLTSASSVVVFLYCFLTDLGRSAGDPLFTIAALGPDAWLTVLGLSLAILAWGIAEGKPSANIGRTTSPILAAAMFYLVFTIIIASYMVAGRALIRLMPAEVRADWLETFRVMERAADVFSPALVVSSLAVAVALLAFAMQASIFVGLQRLGTPKLRDGKLRVMRERAAPELLLLLATRSPAAAEYLRDALPFRLTTRTVVKTLLRLEEAGAVFKRLKKDGSPEYGITNSGRALAIALNELV